jgi:integrase
MPTPRKYIAKNGRVTYHVRFRISASQTSERFDTLREAKAFCSDIQTRDSAYALRILDETNQATTNRLDLIAEAFFTWKATRVRSDRTVFDYRREYKNWIQPSFGARSASSIDESDIQLWVDSMLAGSKGHKALSAKSVMDKHALLHAIYGYALAPSRRLVEANPCIGTELPKRHKGQPKGLKPAEWAALYGALANIDQDAADFTLFLLATGWRWSEVAALSAYDVWYENETTYVTVSHVVRRNAAGQHAIVEDAKSTAGQRRIAIDTEAAAMVARRLANVQGDGLVFTTSTGAQWHYANFRNRAWAPAVKAADLARKPSPHWLRHTHVVWMAMSGANLAELQSRIGHESIATTINVYGRMLTDVAPKALEGFAAMRGVKEIEG